MTPAPSGQTILFVGGAPRSGTTVLHQLLCTSGDTNVYHPEISFVFPLVQSYEMGINTWELHTKAFFENPEQFRQHLGKYVEDSMQHVSHTLGHPKVLTVKSPNLTPYFPSVQSLLGKRARFVTTIRHPYTVIRSLHKVHNNLGKPFSVRKATVGAHQFMATYKHLDDPKLAGKEFVLKYEDLLNPKALQDLRAFTGMDDIDPSKLGTGEPAKFTVPEKNNPWYSPKYDAKIDLSNRLSPLIPSFSKVVYEICAPLMERFGYKDEV